MLKASKIRQSHETEPPKPRGQATAPPRDPASGSRDCRRHRENPLPSRATETDTERVGERGWPTGPPPTRGAPRHASGRLRHPHSPPSFPACLGTRVRKPGALVPGTPLQQRPRGCGPSGGSRHSLLGSRAAMSGFPRVLVRPEGFLRTDLAVVIRMWPLSWPPPDTGKGVRSKPSRRERTHPPASAPWARGLKTLQLQMVLHQAAEKN